MFFSISHFRKRLKALLKSGHTYSGAPQEIHDAFVGQPIEQIIMNRDMVLMDDEKIVIKLRLPNHQRRWSSSQGYRLYYLVDKVDNWVVLLDIYPKKGPLQQLALTRQEQDDLLNIYTQEKETHTLEPYKL